MLGFTLSKLNLLILVTALFAIISFFLFSLTGLVVSNLSQQMVSDYSASVFGLVVKPNFCRTSSFTVPESIEYFGGMMPSQRFYYLMYIKRFPEIPEEGKLNTLIFQIASRVEPDKVIAASSIDLNSAIFLYDYDPENDILSEGSMITIDPMSAGLVTKNSMVLIKEVYQGKSNLHIIACSSSAGICEMNKGKASCWLANCADEPRESLKEKEGCLPKAEECGSCGDAG